MFRRALPMSVNGETGIVSNSYPVEVKPSPGKGMGVFATRNIKRGDVCCYYDGIIAPPIIGVWTTGRHGYTQFVGQEDDGDSLTIAGFPKELAKGGVAQLCNDAATDYDDDKDLNYLKHINVREYIFTKDNQHCSVFRATKRIKKGQELFYTYGASYWKGKKKRWQDCADKDPDCPRDKCHELWEEVMGEKCIYNPFAADDTLDDFVERAPLAVLVAVKSRRSNSM